MKPLYKKIPRKPRTLASQCLLAGRNDFHAEFDYTDRYSAGVIWTTLWICNKIVKMHLTKSPKCYWTVSSTVSSTDRFIQYLWILSNIIVWKMSLLKWKELGKRFEIVLVSPCYILLTLLTRYMQTFCLSTNIYFWCLDTKLSLNLTTWMANVKDNFVHTN